MSAQNLEARAVSAVEQAKAAADDARRLSRRAGSVEGADRSIAVSAALKAAARTDKAAQAARDAETAINGIAGAEPWRKFRVKRCRAVAESHSREAARASGHARLMCRLTTIEEAQAVAIAELRAEMSA